MNLDDLQKQWQDIVGPKPGQQHSVSEDHQIDKHLRLMQRKTINSNILVSVAFAFSFAVIFYIRSINTDRHWTFYLSIDMILVLMIITAIIFWNRVLFWKNPYSMNTKEFIAHFERKLKLRKFILTIYLPVYMTILAAAINLYYYSILKGTENIIQISVYSLTNYFFVLVYWLGRKHHLKKEKAMTEPIYMSLEQLKSNIFETKANDANHINEKGNIE